MFEKLEVSYCAPLDELYIFLSNKKSLWGENELQDEVRLFLDYDTKEVVGIEIPYFSNTNIDKIFISKNEYLDFSEIFSTIRPTVRLIRAVNSLQDIWDSDEDEVDHLLNDWNMPNKQELNKFFKLKPKKKHITYRHKLNPEDYQLQQRKDLEHV